MGRKYIVSEPAFNLAAAMDLAQIKGAANKMLYILSWSVKMAALDGVLPSAQTLALRCRHLPATVTDGSGGATPTPRAIDPGDPAATFTALTRNTTKASSSGTVRILTERGCHIYNGYEMAYGDDAPPIPPSTSFVLELTNTNLIGATNTVSIEVEVEEEG